MTEHTQYKRLMHIYLDLVLVDKMLDKNNTSEAFHYALNANDVLSKYNEIASHTMLISLNNALEKSTSEIMFYTLKHPERPSSLLPIYKKSIKEFLNILKEEMEKIHE